MTGFWLLSYIVLWLLLVGLSLLMLGLLRQVGLLQRQLDRFVDREQGTTDTDFIPLEKDGPAIGSILPELTATTINTSTTLVFSTLSNEYGVLLLFMTPSCRSCQDVVNPLNKLLDSGAYSGNVITILRSDIQGCQAFLSVFPLSVPVVCDRDKKITKQFDVHRSPFGLLYDEQGHLIRKGVVQELEDIQALLGDTSVPLAVQSNVFPPLSSVTNMLT